MWVVKIGGSLQSSTELGDWLEAIYENGKGRIVIVAGGGEFANTVRQSQREHGFDDRTAHRMALLAMEQYAHMLKGLMPELDLVTRLSSIQSSLANNRVALWLPFQMVDADSSLPANWELTADSLAAWLAIKMRMNSLILVKSVALPDDYLNLEQLADRDLIDPLFAQVIEGEKVHLYWMTGGEFSLLPALLNKIPGTEDDRPARFRRP